MLGSRMVAEACFPGCSAYLHGMFVCTFRPVLLGKHKAPEPRIPEATRNPNASAPTALKILIAAVNPGTRNVRSNLRATSGGSRF